LLASSQSYAGSLKEHYRGVRARLQGPSPEPQIAPVPAQSTPAPSDVVWGVKDIADVLGLSLSHVQHLLNSGQLPATKIGKSWVSRRSVLLGMVPIAQIPPSDSVEPHSVHRILARLAWVESELAALRGTSAIASDFPSPRAIKIVVAEFYGFSPQDMHSQARSPSELVFARHVAYYLCCKLSGLSTIRIGRYFGGRDHTTIIHGRDRIAKLRLEDRDLDLQLAELEQALVDNRLPTTEATEQMSEHQT
jgi:excisionase family DNA binding protein